MSSAWRGPCGPTSSVSAFGDSQMFLISCRSFKWEQALSSRPCPCPWRVIKALSVVAELGSHFASDEAETQPPSDRLRDVPLCPVGAFASLLPSQLASSASLEGKGQLRFTSGRWSPHHNCTQVATANDTAVRGWDTRSMR